MSKGWIKYHRSSFENKLYFADPFTRWQAWMDLVLLANHKEGMFFKRGNKIIVPRGTVAYSKDELAKRWSWSRGKVLRFLEFLEHPTVQQIVQQKNSVLSLISITNYERYNGGSTPNQTETDTTDGQQTDTNKNVEKYFLVKKGEKNEKKIIGDHRSGEDLFASKYGNSFPKIDYGSKNDIGGEK